MRISQLQLLPQLLPASHLGAAGLNFLSFRSDVKKHGFRSNKTLVQTVQKRGIVTGKLGKAQGKCPGNRGSPRHLQIKKCLCHTKLRIDQKTLPAKTELTTYMRLPTSTLPKPADLLAHGANFRFVDEILSWDEHGVVAFRDVPLVEHWTADHFPGAPIVPGVLLLEGMIQTSGLLARLLVKDNRYVAGRLASVRAARFLREVLPGARVIYRAQLYSRIGDLFCCNVSAEVEGHRVAEASTVLALRQVSTPPHASEITSKHD